MAINLRSTKGSALTHDEMDTNLTSFYVSSSLDGSTLNFYTHGTGSFSATTHSIDLGIFLDNADEQTLSIVGNDLSISNGNTVTLPIFSGDYNDLSNTPDVSLSLVVNDLILTKLDGTTDTVDLTPYLDEDARAIASGVLDSVTGIVTFTRDDSTTFTLDLSDLLDNTNLVTSVNGKNGVVEISLQDVCDVDSTTTTTITATNFITTSDERLKSNIQPIRDGLGTLKRFLSYEYVKDGQQDAGFLAQEVQHAIPYSVSQGKNRYLTMNDRPILAHMHKAILELEQRIAAIESKLD